MLSPAAGSSCPCGSHAGARGLWDGKASEVLPASHLLPGQVMEGLVSGPRPRGRRGEQVRTQLWPAGLQRSSGPASPSILRPPGPHEPPCLQLLSAPSPSGRMGRAQLRRCSVAGSSLVLESRGEEGAAVRQRGGGQGVLQNWG